MLSAPILSYEVLLKLNRHDVNKIEKERLSLTLFKSAGSSILLLLIPTFLIDSILAGAEPVLLMCIGRCFEKLLFT